MAVGSEWYAFFLLVLLLCIKYVWSRRRLYALSWSLPGPIALPIIGNGLRFLCAEKDFLNNFSSMFMSDASPQSIWFGPKFAVAFTDVNQVEKVITSSTFTQKPNNYRFLIPCFGDSLITSSGPKWRAGRQLVSQFFTNKSVNNYFPICIKHTNILIDILKEQVNQPTFDIEKYINRCVVDIIAESFMGFKLHAQNGDADELCEILNRLYILVHSRVMKPWLQSDFIFKILGYEKSMVECSMTIKNFFKKCLKSAKTRRHTENNSSTMNKETFKSMLDVILDITEDNPNISMANDKELIDLLNTLFNAAVAQNDFHIIKALLNTDLKSLNSTDSVSLTVYEIPSSAPHLGHPGEDSVTRICNFALVMFGMYPEIQNRIVAELDEVIGLKSRTIQLKDLPNLVYLQMCIKELMRLFPVAPFILREASEDFQIDNRTIPSGCTILIHFYNISRDSKHWEKPEEFYPEHFLPEAVSKRHPYAYLPFSAGSRSCIGKTLANMAIPVILATILQKYIVEAHGTLKDITLTCDICVKFADGYPVRLKERN